MRRIISFASSFRNAVYVKYWVPLIGIFINTVITVANRVRFLFIVRPRSNPFSFTVRTAVRLWVMFLIAFKTVIGVGSRIKLAIRFLFETIKPIIIITADIVLWVMHRLAMQCGFAIGSDVAIVHGRLIRTRAGFGVKSSIRWLRTYIFGLEFRDVGFVDRPIEELFPYEIEELFNYTIKERFLHRRELPSFCVSARVGLRMVTV